MKLRLGQPVHSDDGPFGVLAEVVVNPEQQKVTHVVVEPTRGYYQSRLVPIWLVYALDDGTLRVSLDESHLRQLQRVGANDFVHHEAIVDGDERWDIGSVDTVAFARRNRVGSLPAVGSLVTNFERVAARDCEIQLTSKVMSSDGYCVGAVHGFVSDDEDDLVAVVVRVGVPGIRHDVLVPFNGVSRVLRHRVELNLGKDDFFGLPHTSTFESTDDGDVSPVQRLRQSAETAGARIAVRGDHAFRRATERLSKALEEES